MCFKNILDQGKAFLSPRNEILASLLVVGREQELK